MLWFCPALQEEQREHRVGGLNVLEKQRTNLKIILEQISGFSCMFLSSSCGLATYKVKQVVMPSR